MDDGSPIRLLNQLRLLLAVSCFDDSPSEVTYGCIRDCIRSVYGDGHLGLVQDVHPELVYQAVPQERLAQPSELDS